MANLLNIVNQQQTPIDEEKLKLLCSQQNVWGYFGLETEVSLALSEAKQLQMVRNFFLNKCRNFLTRTLLISIRALEALFETHQD